MSLRDDQMMVVLRLAGVEPLQTWLHCRKTVIAMLREALRYRGNRYSLRRGEGLLYCATEGPHPRDLIAAILWFDRATNALLRELRFPEHAHVEITVRRRMALKAKRTYGTVLRTYTRMVGRPPPGLARPYWMTRHNPLHAVWRPRLPAPATL